MPVFGTIGLKFDSELTQTKELNIGIFSFLAWGFEVKHQSDGAENKMTSSLLAQLQKELNAAFP